ncbi:MAG: hypothetical protein IPL08_10390 [Saprospiraceae bacterium]|nr:hypothetical protein [Saprospiraceae bacterium]
MMDVRSRTIADPDKRVGDRIAKLNKTEQGFMSVKSLMMNDRKVAYKTVGTILESHAFQTLCYHSTVVFDIWNLWARCHCRFADPADSVKKV